MKLVVATRNAGKLRELRELLGPLGYTLCTLEEAGVHDEVEEDAETFEGNAEKKARAALAATGCAALADDSGLEVDALGGAPGVRSARYAAPFSPGVEGRARDAANTARLIDQLAAVRDDQRSARFRCALVYLEPSGRRIAVAGACEGRIARAGRGTGGFGYDPVFLVEDGGHPGDRTMAELSSEEKNRISHRARAIAALAATLARGDGKG